MTDAGDKKVIIYNPYYGTKHCGPLTDTEVQDIKEIVEKVKQIKAAKPHFFNNRTIIQGIRDAESDDKSYKIGFYNFTISKGRMELQEIIKQFPEDTDVDSIVDKWGDILGYLFWRGTICKFKPGVWTEADAARKKEEDELLSNK